MEPKTTPTHIMTRSEFLAKSAELGGPIVVGNEFGRFDVALPSGDSESYDSMQEAQDQMLLGMGLGEFPAFFIMLADGGYQKTSLTAPMYCDGCDGSGFALASNGYDGSGAPHFEMAPCKVCGVAK
jgi:hypothetical protein